MVAIKEQANEIFCCPNCSTQLKNIIKGLPVKTAGIDIREINGFCSICDTWVDLRQYCDKSKVWQTYCYCLVVIKNRQAFRGKQNQIKELPTPAVVTGPGGDYQESYLNNG